MESLFHRHLTTLTLDVDFPRVVPIGATPAGFRGIAPVRGGSFAGERLKGRVRPGQDWFVTRSDGTLVIDVRLILDTGDSATIYLNYQGRMTGQGDAMARFRQGEVLDQADYSLAITAKFECGDERYAWLNDVVAAGTGRQTAAGPVYTIFEIGA